MKHSQLSVRRAITGVQMLTFVHQGCGVVFVDRDGCVGVLLSLPPVQHEVQEREIVRCGHVLVISFFEAFECFDRFPEFPLA